jgi:hypothetical protein
VRVSKVSGGAEKRRKQEKNKKNVIFLGKSFVNQKNIVPLHRNFAFKGLRLEKIRKNINIIQLQHD